MHRAACLGALAGLAILAGPAGAQAPAPEPWSARTAPATARQDLAGRTVRASDGAVLGKVERVVLGSDGAPVQVLVRPDGVRAPGYRVLPSASLKPRDGELTAPLTKAEFASLPLIEAPPVKPGA